MLLYMTPLSPAAHHKLLLHNRNRNTAVSTGGHTAKRLTFPTLRHTSTETYTATSTTLATPRRPTGHPEGAKGLNPVSAHMQHTQRCCDSYRFFESAYRHYERSNPSCRSPHCPARAVHRRSSPRPLIYSYGACVAPAPTSLPAQTAPKAQFARERGDGGGGKSKA